MRIGICDDEGEMRKQIRQMCQEVLRRNRMSGDFVEFASGKEVAEYGDKLDYLILDIEMPGMDGIEVKEKFQLEGEETLIIYVTSYQEYVRKAFGKNVYDFVDKVDLTKELPRVFENAIRMQSRFVMIDGYINSKDVVYISVDHNYVDIFLMDGERIFLRKPMKEMEELLKQVDFARVHRKYLVNFRWVKSISEKHVKMLFGTGEEVEVDLRGKIRKNVIELYKDYVKRNARYYR